MPDPLTHCAGPGIEPASWHYRDAADPIESQWELLHMIFFFFFRATLAAYGGSQARGQIGAIAAGLHHSHSNSGSEQCF